ncbi:MAG: class I SAM-dependent methyltransferase [Thermoplasmata archaeon]
MPRGASRKEFDREASGYDTTARRTMPRYRELHQMLEWGVPYLPTRPFTVLELGCGTGTLTARFLAAFPHARITAVDISDEMLRRARTKTRLYRSRVEFHRGHFVDLKLPGPFDAVVSALAIHHLSDPEKGRLFKTIARWLPSGGYFGNADDHLPEDPLFDYRFREIAAEVPSGARGSSTGASRAWHRHDLFDHPTTLGTELELLRRARFGHVGVPWRFLGQAVIWAYR